MNLLFDTNILIFLTKNLRSKQISKALNPENQNVYISVVTVAELKSIALQNNWGSTKSQILHELLEDMTIIEVNESLINIYAEIDAFSQCKSLAYPSRTFSTPRNMGKNDLWIASTVALLGLKLVTTDNDFNHLHQVFIEVQNIKPEIFKG
ncbi:type II toxin-antitoxin system VapC family toxin [Mucilaginibacter sp. BJC16-A38]|uniref:type II toxin-antitoxin system VapC family toxin n=1 Tax=Mucilaginibacter phenanthrenivorans TaxID=1234842 RepID=UPI0021571988|nr:type II toxin-antitoxin system VapC family toxin [Mucilaginibacter phenanthrenivorans]MCR8561932.1 type II toxin-antitoxin system VapC family toxin [Mucilaginibacter phenanthrenivorans]